MSTVHMLQMTKGQDVTSTLYAYLADKQWKGVVILGGIGSVTSMTVAVGVAVQRCPTAKPKLT